MARAKGGESRTTASPPSCCYGNERGKHAGKWQTRRATAGWAGEEACDLASPFSRATSRRHSGMKPRAIRSSPPRQHVLAPCARARERAHRRREQPAAAHPPPSGNCAGSGIAHALISIMIGLAGILTACSLTTATCGLLQK